MHVRVPARMCVYVCVWVCACVCVRVRARVRACVCVCANSPNVWNISKKKQINSIHGNFSNFSFNIFPVYHFYHSSYQISIWQNLQQHICPNPNFQLITSSFTLQVYCRKLFIRDINFIKTRWPKKNIYCKTKSGVVRFLLETKW